MIEKNGTPKNEEKNAQNSAGSAVDFIRIGINLHDHSFLPELKCAAQQTKSLSEIFL
jgi:hypothetical protein